MSDVSDRQQRSQLVERVAEEFGGKLHILSEGLAWQMGAGRGHRAGLGPGSTSW